ncbi:MAG TPA: DUF1501 domain-containing protein [Fimbriiglobus sp.]|nr:DUF1501 domain-containing protein [Fimbriiglobus sp.]
MSASLDLSRRSFFRVGAVSLGASLCPWFGSLASAAAGDPSRKRSCILLWMAGGPATIDLWDLKPGHDNGGPYRPIDTTAPGLRFGEHLPQMAMWGHRMAVLRSMSTKEGEHQRATYLMRTGNMPTGPIQYPSIGALLSKELGDPTSELPNFVSVAPQRFFNLDAYGPGFLGPQYAPLIVGEGGGFGAQPTENIDQLLKVKNLDRPKAVGNDHAAARFDLLRQMQEGFAAAHPGAVPASHVSAYDRAARLMQSASAKAFDLSEEKKERRDRYGRTLFGQGCLLARRLVERGVPFVEVTLGNWDTHQNNFDRVKELCGNLDKAWSALMHDLKDRGLLDSTLIVWMGEFGRTPRINGQNGRDHFPSAWSTVLAGGGVKGGQAVGKTSRDGTTVTERPVSTIDLLATVCQSLGVDSEKQNLSNVGRPIRIVDKTAKPVMEVVA